MMLFLWFVFTSVDSISAYTMNGLSNLFLKLVNFMVEPSAGNLSNETSLANL